MVAVHLEKIMGTDRRYGVIPGMAIKVPCAACSTAPITLSGLQTVDAVALVAGDRCLVAGQTDQTTNGIYVVDTGTWTRDLDFDGQLDVVTGTLIKVNGGASNNGFWYVTTIGSVVIGTSNITFGRASTVLAVVSAFMQTVLPAVSAAAARALLGIDTVDTQIHAATTKATPVDADEFGFWDSVSAALRKLTWANLKTALLSTAMTWLKPQTAQALALTSSTTWDGSTYQSLTVDVNGSSFTVAAANAVPADKTYVGMFIKYTTTHAIAFTTGSAKSFSGVTSFVGTGTAGKYDHLVFRYDSGTDRFMLVGYTKDCAA